MLSPWLQVVFLGEYHDDAIAHSLELELLQQAQARYGSQAAEQAPAADGPLDSQGQGKVAPPQQARRSVSLSLEMLERDVQSVVDEYLAGHVRERDLAHVSACIWCAVLLCADAGTWICLQRLTCLLQSCLAWALPACLVACMFKGGHGHEPTSVRPRTPGCGPTTGMTTGPFWRQPRLTACQWSAPIPPDAT